MIFSDLIIPVQIKYFEFTNYFKIMTRMFSGQRRKSYEVSVCTFLRLTIDWGQIIPFEGLCCYVRVENYTFYDHNLCHIWTKLQLCFANWSCYDAICPSFVTVFSLANLSSLTGDVATIICLFASAFNLS